MLFNALVGSSYPTDAPTVSPSVQEPESFVLVDYLNNSTINQIQRKIRLLNEFKQYIQNTDETTVYYNYIKGTQMHYRSSVYMVSVGIFGGLYESRISGAEDFFELLLSI